MDFDNEVMTAKELGDYLKVDEQTVTRLAKKGELPGKKVGHLWRFNRAAIRQWFQVSSSPEEPR